MNRRTFLATAACASLGASAGCADGVIGAEAQTAFAETTTMPELGDRDVSPEGAVTTFEIRWRAKAATRFDVRGSDGMETTPYTYTENMQFIVLGFEAKNIGEETQMFDPDSLILQAGEETYYNATLTHLTPYAVRPIRPGVTTSGWAPILAPEDLESAEVSINQRKYNTPIAVEFVHDSSVWLPF